MSFVELLIIAVGLSMDAFAVSIGKGLTLSKPRWCHYVSVGLWFGGFQALMPLVGYLLGAGFAEAAAEWDHWIAFVLLMLIGGNMIREAYGDDEECATADFGWRTMLLLAIATSIDALAVGVSFAFLGVTLLTSVVVIGLTTLSLSMVGLRIGRLFGARFQCGAEVLGGLILMALGVKILIEHTLL